jgi:trans-2,3-dihydro-3-hydroxyanthranilate isomerase
MPFAGHPNVGTGFVLAVRSRDSADVLRFEEQAGLVEVRVQRDASGAPCGAVIDAPQPLQLLGELSAAEVAACIGLSDTEVLMDAHPPVRATTGVEFVHVEVAEDALGKAAPDIAAFRAAAAAHAELGDRLSIHLYARTAEGVRARMFAPLSGTWEDPATGSANATLAALLLSLCDDDGLAYQAVQGVEMGRRSVLEVSARRTAEGIRARVGGRCVPVLSGEAEV